MTIVDYETIWFPGIYGGRTDANYTKLVKDISLVDLTLFVQKRAQEDGQWAIDNGFVGNNEDKMCNMMIFVSNPVMIQQCFDHILEEGLEGERTVDYVCRDLANASKWAEHD